MQTKTVLQDILSRLAISPSGFTFDPQTGRSFTLNATGLTVMLGLRQGRSVKELSQELEREYQVIPERIEASLADFVCQLEREFS